jgi:peptide/nickel transport system permease protein
MRALSGHIAKRVLHSVLALIGLLVLVFFLARLTGNPADLYLPIDAAPELRQQFSAEHGFNDPVIVQFGHYVGAALHLDFGQSLRDGRPALGIVLAGAPWTLMLAAITMVISLALGIVIGSLAAAKPGGVFDRVTTFLSLMGVAAPNFWIGIVGILVFAIWLRVLPTSGTGGPLYWILPVTVLALRPCGILAQVVRASMIGALSSGYVKTARAKGVRRRSIIFVHTLRNAMLPVITVAGDQAASLVNGAVIVETMFGFPGIGHIMIDAILYRDFAVVQATVLVIAIAVFILNLVIDFAYAALDPRVRT